MSIRRLAILGAAVLMMTSGCGLADGAAQSAIAEVAQGTWRCEAPGRTTYTYEIAEGTWQVDWDDSGATGATEFEGTWAIVDGDLTIDLPWAASDRNRLVVAGAGDLHPGDAPVDIALGGPAAMIFTDDENGMDTPVEIVSASTDQVVLQRGTGDRWTCTRR